MDQLTAICVLDTLSSGVRLDVFRLLVRRGRTGMVAGEIAATLAVPSTNLSFHLKALAHAGLVSAVQEGRFQRYRANLSIMHELVAYLTQECCDGQPELCADWMPGPRPALPPADSSA